MFPSIPKVETTSEKINDGIGIWHSQLEKGRGVVVALLIALLRNLNT